MSHGTPSRTADATDGDAEAAATCATSRRSSSGTTSRCTTPRRIPAGREALHARAHRRASTASRRAGCSRTSTRTTSSVRKVEGNPAHPGRAAATAPRARRRSTRSTTPSGSSTPLRRDGERGGGQWERGDLGRRARRHRRAHPRSDRRGPARRGDVPRRAARRGRLRRARAADVGRRRPQQPHQRLLGRRAALGYSLWGGNDRPSPDYANAKVHPAAVRAPGDRPLLQPARAADHRGQGQRRRQARRDRPAAVEHRRAGRLWLRAVAGHRGGAAAGDRRAPARRRTTSTGTSCERWVNWRPT